jgi:3-(3-hydroxy-phenyl)propionate hydroxylase
MPTQRLEPLDEALLPRRAPRVWTVIVRPDRCVMAEGPVEQVETILEQALRRIPPAAKMTVAQVMPSAPSRPADAA